MWLGITDRRQEGMWQTIDDWFPVLYANWAPYEPNDYGGREDHAVMRSDGKWNDHSGSHKTFCAVPSKFMFFFISSKDDE